MFVLKKYTNFHAGVCWMFVLLFEKRVSRYEDYIVFKCHVMFLRALVSKADCSGGLGFPVNISTAVGCLNVSERRLASNFRLFIFCMFFFKTLRSFFHRELCCRGSMLCKLTAVLCTAASVKKKSFCVCCSLND